MSEKEIKAEEKDMRFIAFLDENNNKIEGIFEIISEDPVLKFKTKENIITIPYTRLLKMKQKGGEE